MSDEELRFTEDFNAMIKIASLASLGFFYMGFLVPVLARTNMNASGLQIGLIVSSLVLGFLLSSTFVGFLTDKVKSKKFLICIGSFGRGASYIIIYIAVIGNSLGVLWIGYFLLGFGAGWFWIPFDTIIAEKSHKDNRAEAYGKRDAANAVGQIIGALMGFGIILFIGLITQEPFIIYSAILIYGVGNFLAGVLFIKTIDESQTIIPPDGMINNKKNNEKSTKIKFPKPMIIGLILLFTLVVLSAINAFLWRPFLNIYILENITDDLNVVIWIYLPAGLLATLLAPKLGELIDKLNPVIGIIATSLIGALMTWLLINTTNLVLFSLILLIDIMVAIAAGLLFRNLLSRINIEHRGKIMGATNFFTNIGALIGPILGGLLWDTLGPKAPFILSIYVELCLIPFYLLVVWLLIPHLEESYEKEG